MSEYLVHYGVKGMKWGVRRYDNEDLAFRKERIKNRFLSLIKRKKSAPENNENKQENSAPENNKKQTGKIGIGEQQKKKLGKGLAIAGGVVAAGVLAYIGGKKIIEISDRKRIEDWYKTDDHLRATLMTKRGLEFGPIGKRKNARLLNSVRSGQLANNNRVREAILREQKRKGKKPHRIESALTNWSATQESIRDWRSRPH